MGILINFLLIVIELISLFIIFLKIKIVNQSQADIAINYNNYDSFMLLLDGFRRDN